MVSLSVFLSNFSRPLCYCCDRLKFYRLIGGSYRPIEFVGYTNVNSNYYYLFRFLSDSRSFCTAFTESDCASSDSIAVLPKRAFRDWFDDVISLPY